MVYKHQIGSTPLSISVYSVKNTSTTMHEEGVLEIIMCLTGSVKFSYAHEEFTLHTGEFISVDKDAYQLYDGEDNVCVSFYIDLLAFETKYPFIRGALFICEGCKDGTMPYPTTEHDRLKGMLLCILKEINENNDEGNINTAVSEIVDMFLKYFNIILYHVFKQRNDENFKLNDELFDRANSISFYLSRNYSRKITIKELAEHFGLTDGYVSEFMRKTSIGFRSMLGYIRANASERLLLNSNKTIVEISEECGFSDAKYYYDAFKRWYKCTPKQFRQKYGSTTADEVQFYSLDYAEPLIEPLIIEHYKKIFLTKK